MVNKGIFISMLNSFSNYKVNPSKWMLAIFISIKVFTLTISPEFTSVCFQSAPNIEVAINSRNENVRLLFYHRIQRKSSEFAAGIFLFLTFSFKNFLFRINNLIHFHFVQNTRMLRSLGHLNTYLFNRIIDFNSQTPVQLPLLPK